MAGDCLCQDLSIMHRQTGQHRRNARPVSVGAGLRAPTRRPFAPELIAYCAYAAWSTGIKASQKPGNKLLQNHPVTAQGTGLAKPHEKPIVAAALGSHAVLTRSVTPGCLHATAWRHARHACCCMAPQEAGLCIKVKTIGGEKNETHQRWFIAAVFPGRLCRT